MNDHALQVVECPHDFAAGAAVVGSTTLFKQVPHLDARAATRLSIKKRGIPKSLACLGLGLADHIGRVWWAPVTCVVAVYQQGAVIGCI